MSLIYSKFIFSDSPTFFLKIKKKNCNDHSMRRANSI